MNNKTNRVIGAIVILGGIVAGVYVGGWLLFVGGILQIIAGVIAPEVIPMDIAMGIVKILLASLVGWLIVLGTSFVGGAIAILK